MATGKRQTIKPRGSIQTTIEKNFNRLLADDRYKKKIGKLNRRQVHTEFEKLKEDYVDFIGFYSYRRHMKIMKIRRGSISGAAERNVVAKGKRAIKAYERMCKRLDKISAMLDKDGLLDAINQHAPRVFRHLEHNPKYPVIIDEFRSMGVPEDSIIWVVNKLRKVDYNPLVVEGANGKFQGLVERASKITPKLTKDLAYTSEHGLPVLAGAGDDEDEYVEAAVVTGVAILVGLIFGFCHDWRDRGVPHVLHWDA